MRSVAIIGAGFAGLTAARQLSRQNLEVALFDKARGVGGRASTRRRESDRFDHGAQYFTCRGEVFTRQTDEWCRNGVAALWTAPVRRLSNGEFVDLETSTHRFVGLPGMSALARDLSTGLEVHCGQRIETIERCSAGYRLIPEDGSALDRFDAVIVATPASQAVPLLSPAPRLAASARSVEMDPCHAAMVSFAEPVGIDLGGAFVTDSPLAWVARNASKPERPGGECWVLHSSANWSAKHLDDPSERVGDALIEALSAALGRALPPVTHKTAHRWLLARANKPLGEAYLWDESLRIGACGDWLTGTRVEDAFTSGLELAQAIGAAR